MSEAPNNTFLGFEIGKDLSSTLWKPEIGEEKAILLERFQSQPGKKGSEFIVAHGIDLVTGESLCFVMGKILENEFENNEVVIGDCVGLRSLPKVRTKKGELASNWEVYILKSMSPEEVTDIQATAQKLKAETAAKTTQKKTPRKPTKK